MKPAKARWLILGAGSFGTAFARIMARRPVELAMAARSEEHVSDLRVDGSNERYFPGISLPSELELITFEDAETREWDVVVLAVPASGFGATIERFANVPGTEQAVFLSLAKGLDASGRRLTDVAGEIIASERLVVLSGPNIAYEMMHDLPTAAVLAGVDMDIVTRLQTVIHGPDFRVYANPDVIGVELAGACKNVVAIAAGVCEAAGFGHNGLGGIMSRGLCEITRLGVASGAQTHTFLGLAGMGDLVTTCSSPHGRNRRAGTLLAQGKTADEVRAEIGQVVEGLRAAPTVAELATRLGVTANICAAVAAVAQQQLALEDVVHGLLHRPPSLEFDPAYGWAGEPVVT